jgi:anti-sigma regulatory factor (Ser/Thr protein kinase)
VAQERRNHVSFRLRAGTNLLEIMHSATRTLDGPRGLRTRHRAEHTRGGASPADCALRLAMPARPENVPVIRHALTGVANALRLETRTTENLRLAVTEACTNVVRHAYGGEDGPLEVRVRSTDEEVTVEIRDHGPGIQPTKSADSLGIGLPLIAGVCDGLRIGQDATGANVVAMTFRREPPPRPRPHLVTG